MDSYTVVAMDKGQVVIPASLRRKYRIGKGTRIRVVDAGKWIVLQPLTESYLRELRGSLPGMNAVEELVKMHAEERMD